MPYLHTVVTHWAKLNTEDILRVVMSCVITKHLKKQIRDNIYEFQVIISFEILSVYFIPGENYEPCFHVVTEQWWKYEIILMKIQFLEQATQPLASVKMQWKHKTEWRFILTSNTKMPFSYLTLTLLNLSSVLEMSH